MINSINRTNFLLIAENALLISIVLCVLGTACSRENNQRMSSTSEDEYPCQISTSNALSDPHSAMQINIVNATIHTNSKNNNSSTSVDLIFKVTNNSDHAIECPRLMLKTSDGINHMSVHSKIINNVSQSDFLAVYPQMSESILSNFEIPLDSLDRFTVAEIAGYPEGGKVQLFSYGYLQRF